MVLETLAQYSSMMVLETAYGPEMAGDSYDFNMREYFRGRSVFTNRESPLLDVVKQVTCTTSRAAWRCTHSAIGWVRMQ